MDVRPEQSSRAFTSLELMRGKDRQGRGKMRTLLCLVVRSFRTLSPSLSEASHMLSRGALPKTLETPYLTFADLQERAQLVLRVLKIQYYTQP